MDILNLVVTVVSGFAGVPLVGKILATVASLAIVIPAIVSSFVMLWHAVVVLLKALSAIPGLSQLSDLSDHLKADEDTITNIENGYVLPILNRLSFVKPPVPNPAVVAAQVAVAQAPAQPQG